MPWFIFRLQPFLGISWHPVTNGYAERFPCDSCGTLTPIEQLDAKPVGWWWSLRAAADAGAAFDRLECRACYGPDWCSLDGSEAPVLGWRRPVVAFMAWRRRRIYARTAVVLSRIGG